MYSGYIGQMDLDERYFTLRFVDDHPLHEIRVTYDAGWAHELKEIFGATTTQKIHVRVIGPERKLAELSWAGTK